MTWDAQTRSDQRRADRRREDQQREDRRREERRLEALRLVREERDRAVAREQARTRAEAEARVRRHAAAARARVEAVLNDPASYVGGQVPSVSSGRERNHAVLQPRQPVVYPSPPIQLRAGQEHRHPDVAGILVEVLPLIGGGQQVGIDWAPYFGRALVTAADLPRSGWQQHRRGAVPFPIELRRAGTGMTLRWVAPTSARPAADQQDLVAALTTFSVTAGAAGWRAWRNRPGGAHPSPTIGGADR